MHYHGFYPLLACYDTYREKVAMLAVAVETKDCMHNKARALFRVSCDRLTYHQANVESFES